MKRRETTVRSEPKYEPDAETLADLETRFTYHPPHGDQVERFADVRAIARRFAIILCEYTPKSREQALALTNLEQAVFWANAAIARNELKEDPDHAQESQEA